MEPCLYFSIALCKISHSHHATKPCLFYKSRVHPCLIMNQSPYQVIHPKHRLPQSLLRITSHESHHPFQLPHPMLHHSTFFQRSVPNVILPEAPSFHYLLQQFLSLPLIRFEKHPRPYSFAMPSVKIYTTYIYAR